MAISKCNATIYSNDRELIDSTIPLFPIAIYDDIISAKTIKIHWHNELEVGYITSGFVIVKTDSGTFTLKEGDGFYIAPGVVHTMDPDIAQNEEAGIRSIVFDPKIVADNSDSLYYIKYLAPLLEEHSTKTLILDKNKNNKILSLISNVWNLVYLESYNFEIEVRHDLTLLTGELCKLPVTSKASTAHTITGARRLKQMLQFINLHFYANITLKDIAASANISTSEALREFNSILNTTPIKYLIQYRLECAEKMLISENFTISTICQQCGFNDLSYFTKAFKEKYGIPPAKYRAAKK